MTAPRTPVEPLAGLRTDPALLAKLRDAARRSMTADEIREQRVSWIIGQTGCSRAQALAAVYTVVAQDAVATPLAVQATDERELLKRCRDGFMSEGATGMPVLETWRVETLRQLNEALAARAQLTQAPAALTDLLPLQRFASAVMESWPGGDLDGGDLQNTAEACGLIAERTVRAPCCDEGCGCAEAGFTGETQCYVQQPILHRAHRASANGISHKGKDE